MKEVNIYIETDIPPMRTDRGRVMYILEAKTAKGPATLTKTIDLESATQNRATAEALAEALERIKEPCRVMIYTDCRHVEAAINLGWIFCWERNGWRTGRGKEVCDAENWKEITHLLEPHEFTVMPNEGSTYKKWMQSELKRTKKDAFWRLARDLSHEVNDNMGA